MRKKKDKPDIRHVFEGGGYTVAAEKSVCLPECFKAGWAD
jgi:hypothetical protein